MPDKTYEYGKADKEDMPSDTDRAEPAKSQTNEDDDKKKKRKLREEGE